MEPDRLAVHPDRVVGTFDATADLRAGLLRINATHKDLELTNTARSAINREIRDLAQWLELELGD